MCSQTFSSSLRWWWIFYARNVQYLPSTTWLILIASDVTAHARAFCGTRAHILPSFFGKVVRACHFRTLTAYNKKTKTNFQKLISKPFSTCLNLSNKLNLWKRCSWPLIFICQTLFSTTFIWSQCYCVHFTETQQVNSLNLLAIWVISLLWWRPLINSWPDRKDDISMRQVDVFEFQFLSVSFQCHGPKFRISFSICGKVCILSSQTKILSSILLNFTKHCSVQQIWVCFTTLFNLVCLFSESFFNSVVHDSHRTGYKNGASATNIVHLLKLKTKQISAINVESYHSITRSASSFFKKITVNQVKVSLWLLLPSYCHNSH